MRKVREEMGLTNLKLMIPFCRTVEEGRRVQSEMAKHGLVRGENGLELYVMCEIPSNVVLSEQFGEIFDGFSIGSNDLTQLILGVDRDSEIVAPIFDERNDAVKAMIAQVIRTCRNKGRKIGICGQAPSDYPEFAEFLVEEGIDSLSLNPDTVLKTTLAITKKEQELKHENYHFPHGILNSCSLSAHAPHCDGLDGPVVQAAQKAIETKNVNLVLIWVQETDDAEIKRLFEHTLEVRTLSPQARELADRFFFESLVRIHRAGEGAGFTGLKAAGRDLGPAIPAADKALREGTVKPLIALLTQAVENSVAEHFAAASRQRAFPADDIAAGRRYVKAYVEYIHAIEALYSLASGPVHGHAPEASAGEHGHH